MDQKRLIQKRNVEMRNISIPPVQNRALTALANRAGHGNASRIVQELLVREAIYQFGADWAARFAEDDAVHESSKAA